MKRRSVLVLALLLGCGSGATPAGVAPPAPSIGAVAVPPTVQAGSTPMSAAQPTLSTPEPPAQPSLPAAVSGSAGSSVRSFEPGSSAAAGSLAPQPTAGRAGP